MAYPSYFHYYFFPPFTTPSPLLLLSHRVSYASLPPFSCLIIPSLASGIHSVPGNNDDPLDGGRPLDDPPFFASAVVPIMVALCSVLCYLSVDLRE